MSQVNLHINIQLVKSKIQSFHFMIKFYQINPELDIDFEFNKFIDDHLVEFSITNANFSGNTQYDSLISALVDRFDFFIETGKITCIDKQRGITEITFNNGQYTLKSYGSHGDIISEKHESNKWDFGRYHILRYHLVQDLKDKLKNLDILDLDFLAVEYNIDKGFLIDFIYSLLSKDFVEITSNEKKSLLMVKSNLDQILNKLDESLNEMELDLVA